MLSWRQRATTFGTQLLEAPHLAPLLLPLGLAGGWPAMAARLAEGSSVSSLMCLAPHPAPLPCLAEAGKAAYRAGTCLRLRSRPVRLRSRTGGKCRCWQTACTSWQCWCCPRPVRTAHHAPAMQAPHRLPRGATGGGAAARAPLSRRRQALLRLPRWLRTACRWVPAVVISCAVGSPMQLRRCCRPACRAASPQRWRPPLLRHPLVPRPAVLLAPALEGQLHRSRCGRCWGSR